MLLALSLQIAMPCPPHYLSIYADTKSRTYVMSQWPREMLPSFKDRSIPPMTREDLLLLSHSSVPPSLDWLDIIRCILQQPRLPSSLLPSTQCRIILLEEHQINSHIRSRSDTYLEKTRKQHIMDSKIRDQKAGFSPSLPGGPPPPFPSIIIIIVRWCNSLWKNDIIIHSLIWLPSSSRGSWYLFLVGWPPPTPCTGWERVDVGWFLYLPPPCPLPSLLPSQDEKGGKEDETTIRHRIIKKIDGRLCLLHSLLLYIYTSQPRERMTRRRWLVLGASMYG